MSSVHVPFVPPLWVVGDRSLVSEHATVDEGVACLSSVVVVTEPLQNHSVVSAGMEVFDVST